MKWLRRRVQQPRADLLAIAALEHGLYGVQPAPGTAAAAVIGLRALAAAGTSMREMMPGMDDCPATSLIHLDGEDIVVICDRGWHSGDDHHDVIHGEWDGSPTATLCPICLASAPRGTNAAREHLLTHDREQLVTVIRALSNDTAQALRKIQGEPGA